MRPDYGRIQRDQRQVTEHAGETAIRRVFVSASAGTPVYGLGDDASFDQHVITGLFAQVQFDEQNVPGGQFYAGDMWASTNERLGPQDEIVWRGTVYRVESDPIPQKITNNTVWRTLLRRGDATG